MIEFEVHGLNPRPKARPRVTRNGTFTPKDTKVWQDAVAAAARTAEVVALEGPVSLVLLVAGALRGDADNYAKSVMDALNGIAYKDDRQVRQLSVVLLKRKTPFCRVQITPLAANWDRDIETPTGA